MPATAASLAATECPNCSGTPMGEGCYHICYNSTHFYSPEQERYDDANWSRSDYLNEMYGNDIDPEYEAYCAERDDDFEGEPMPATTEDFAPMPSRPGALACPAEDDDIPF